MPIDPRLSGPGPAWIHSSKLVAAVNPWGIVMGRTVETGVREPRHDEVVELIERLLGRTLLFTASTIK